MIANLVSIGNSKAICLPDIVIEKCQFGNVVELQIENHHLEIHAIKSPRWNWDEQLIEMAKNHDDQLLDNPTPTKWDENEWEW